MINCVFQNVTSITCSYKHKLVVMLTEDYQVTVTYQYDDRLTFFVNHFPSLAQPCVFLLSTKVAFQFT